MVQKTRKLNRTVTYWRLVDVEKGTAVEEVNWTRLLHNLHGGVVRHQVLDKIITGTAWAVEPPSDVVNLLEPDIPGLSTSGLGSTLYGLVASTQRDYLPVQQFDDGTLKPLAIDLGARPAVNSFLWFLPFGNIFALMKEDLTAVHPTSLAHWLSVILRERDMLPYGCHGLKAVPVVDEESRNRLRHATALRSVLLAGEIKHADSSLFGDLLSGGPQFEGAYTLQIKVIPKRNGANPRTLQDDREKLLGWFEGIFGSLTAGSSVDELTAARVKMDGPDVPHDEYNVIQHRLTRKRKVEVRHDESVTLAPIAAFEELYKAYTIDYSELLRLR